MISLLLTLFISLFTFCPSIHQVDHKVNNIINDVESQPKNFGHLDEEGIQFYMPFADFYNADFIRLFINNLPTYYGVGMGTASTTDCYIDLNGSSIYTMSYGHVVDNRLYIPDLLRLNKYTVTLRNYESEEYYEMHYFLTMYDVYNDAHRKLFEFEYLFSVPFLDYYAHDVGISCTYVTNNYNIYSSGDICYIENSNSGDTPLYTYGYTAYKGMINNQASYNQGFNNGYASGSTNGYNQGYDVGRQVGYQEGLDTLDSTNSTASTIFEGIFDVGLLPVNVFLTIFNFEVFGVNIAGIISGLLTLSVAVIVLRFLLGGKKDD